MPRCSPPCSTARRRRPTPGRTRSAPPCRPPPALAADRLLADYRPGVGNLAFARTGTPAAAARDQFVKFLDALLADARMGDDIATTNAHFRLSISEADFAAVRRNHRARAELTDIERVIGEPAVGIVARTE